MTDPNRPPMARRAFLRGAAAAGGLLLGGCDSLSGDANVQTWLGSVENLNRYLQRLLLDPAALAPEFQEADLSPRFRANGSTRCEDPAYRRHLAGGFADWRLQVVGEVERPAEFSLADLRAMPARTQITRHDCVEGWSCIGKWSGVQLSQVLTRVGLKNSARFVIFHCADAISSAPYYESIDLIDAVHPQTILAYDMNGAPLQEPYGAPLRLRLERQLGYKMAKFIMRIEVAGAFAHVGAGKGGFWEDRGYEWYAGI
jgi:DMSO/TMAO reductase YedYZ molybdopterin-dependent catalytic subunit